MSFIDCHCHVADNFFYKNIEQQVKGWEAEKISKIGCMATNPKTTKRNQALGKKYPKMFVVSAGRHPWGAHKFDEAEQLFFEQVIPTKEIKVIGEIGLDFYFVKDQERYVKQREVLEFFIELANKYNKPVMIHQTGAEEAILDMLTTFNLNCNICSHWYSGSKATLKKLVDLGCFFSVNPAFLHSKKHQAIVKLAPKDKLLTESDGPVKFEDKRSSPSLMPFICSELSKQLNCSFDDLVLLIENNYRRFLQ